MLAGLIFAIQDADDRPGTLAATLPFGGLTLIEYQARLLVGAGASQIVVLVARVTPELLGAIARIGRRGVTVDTVRSAGEAAAKLHPLARVVMLADGLVTTEALLAPLAREGGDALLVVAASDAPAEFERVGGRSAWAGIARLAPQRLAEVAALPRDYDVQSALLRVADQAGAVHVAMVGDETRAGHGIERRGVALEARSHAVIAAVAGNRAGWFDRWIIAPVARRVLPALMRRGIGAIVPAAVAGGLAGVGLGLIWFDFAAFGLPLALAGVIAAGSGAMLAWLRDEARIAQGLHSAMLAIPAVAALLLGRSIDMSQGSATAEVLALALVASAALAERAASEDRRARWWGSPAAYLLVLTLATVMGAPTTGLALAAVYSAATLAAAIETLRRNA